MTYLIYLTITLHIVAILRNIRKEFQKKNV
jgi:hypothetical protein